MQASLTTRGLRTATASAASSGGPVTSAPAQVVVGTPPITVVEGPSGDLEIPEAGKSEPVTVRIDSSNLWPGVKVTVKDGENATAIELPGPGDSRDGSLILAGTPLGPRTLVIDAVAKIGSVSLSSTARLSFTAKDGTPPVLTVTSPPSGAAVVADASHPVTLTGTCTDKQSGIATGSIGAALSALGPFTPAATGPGTSLVTWTATVTPPGRGSFTAYVKVADNSGKSTLVPWPLEAISSYVPPTLEARLSSSQYLAALTTFARDTVTTPAGAVGTADLATLLSQPISQLADPDPNVPAAVAGSVPVNELRIPIEILRAWVSGMNPPLADPLPGQSEYLHAAYEALLEAAGTSYAELRLARGADQSVRQALADRLGIELRGAGGLGTRPDQLDQLTLGGDGLTEAALEERFGLAQTTTGDPLRTISPPSLLMWQTAGQTTRWAAEDHAPGSPLAGVPVVDPDVISAADISTSAAPAVTALLAQRQGQLVANAAAVTAAIAAASPAAKLATAVATSQPGLTTDKILAWRASERAGGDSSASLNEAGLDRSGYRWLLRMADISGAGQDVTDDEWADTVAVLTGAYRRTQYTQWKAEEASVVSLTPDLFKAAATGPTVSPFRIPASSRQVWLRVLAIRTSQRQNVVDASAAATTYSEQRALPVLRDALLRAVSSSGGATATAESLARRYQLDFLAGGSLTTTRLAQATASVQTLLESIRSGDTQGSPAQAWALKDSNPSAFDAAWSWFGGIDSWRQATQAFLFPEAALDPALVETPSSQFQTLRSSLAALAGDPVAAVAKAVRDYVTSSGGQPSFGYQSGRNPAHQKDLDALSQPLTPAVALEAYWAVPLLAARTLMGAGAFQAALDWLWVVYPYTDPAALSCYHPINVEAASAIVGADLTQRPGWTSDLNPFHLVAGRPAPYLRNALLHVATALIRYGDSEFSTEDAASVEHARQLYESAQRLLAHPALIPVAPSSAGEPTLAIPQSATLNIQAANQLAKIRQGRNIAGLPRTTAAAIGTGASVHQPTPYHFKLLMTRAQQTAQQAVQFEVQYLSLLEKFDAKTMTLTEAQYAGTLTGLQSHAQKDRVQQAVDGVAAAQAQADKAHTMVATYQDQLNTPNPYEKNLLNDYGKICALQDVLGLTQGVIEAAAAANQAAGGAFWSAGASVAAAVPQIAGIAIRTGTQIALNEVQRESQVDSLHASQEERRRQLATQLASAAQDVIVAAAQQQVSTDQLTIATAEQAVVDSQHQHAADVLALLGRQFTSADLYQWMSDTLGAVYQYFLQQATATARLAQAQLAFERVERPRDFVGTDYWTRPGPAQSTPNDSRGMTGAERLTEDLSQLEQYAFSSDVRRLNVTQTFSLARQLPVDFLAFRSSGQLAFSTPSSWFDEDFPGHYQRLIRQVRLSVVALVPPTRGIRASLSSTGISRVTTPAEFGTFTSVTVRRDPSTIVATSPSNATGVFVLDVQPELLLPFEGSGVETTWLLSMPQAANPFDFTNIADVILSLDYTAMTDPDHQAQVVQSLNRDRGRSSDRVLSLSRDLPDQWYALRNPTAGHSRDATFTISPGDFPVGFTDVACAQVAVLLKTDDASTLETPVTVTLTWTGPDGAAVGGVAAADSSGMVSTRRGAAQWQPMIGASPVGTWRIAFDASADPLFAGPLSDILLMITWQAQAPAWPT